MKYIVRYGLIAACASLLCLSSGCGTSGERGEEVFELVYAGEVDALASYIAAHPEYDLDVRDHNGLSPLHWAAYDLDLDMVQILLAHGANPNVKDVKELTPLLYVVWRPAAAATEIIKDLIAHGADVNIPSPDGVRPVMWAVKHGVVSNVEVLIREGALLDAVDSEGRTVTDYARRAKTNHVAVLSLIEASEVDEPKNESDGGSGSRPLTLE